MNLSRHPLKKNAEFNGIKVVMVTGKDEYKLIAEAFRAGCDDYIIKPVDRNELTAKIGELTKTVLCCQKLCTFFKKIQAC